MNTSGGPAAVAVEEILTLGAADLAQALAVADDRAQRDGTAELAPLYAAAALAGATLASVEKAAEFTRQRRFPRPVPGVRSATADPLSQVVLGETYTDALGAIAAVRGIAAEIDGRPGDAIPATAAPDRAAVEALALTAFEVAVSTAIAQGERVWEVAGTSGSDVKHGFQQLWPLARTAAARYPRSARRRAIGHAVLNGELAV